VIKNATTRTPVGGCSEFPQLRLAANQLLRRGDFTSREDLETRITAFTIRHNKRARPYKWSYDADAEHARYLERHPQPEHRPPSPKPHDSNAVTKDPVGNL
jgi:hypothetical protein